MHVETGTIRTNSADAMAITPLCRLLPAADEGVDTVARRGPPLLEPFTRIKTQSGAGGRKTLCVAFETVADDQAPQLDGQTGQHSCPRDSVDARGGLHRARTRLFVFERERLWAQPTKGRASPIRLFVPFPLSPDPLSFFFFSQKKRMGSSLGCVGAQVVPPLRAGIEDTGTCGEFWTRQRHT